VCSGGRAGADFNAMMIKTQRRRNCRGISTLEFIVVLPFLLLIMLSGVELSRALYSYNVVVQAAREGARVGAVTPTASGDVFVNTPALQRITTILSSAKMAPGPGTSVSCPTRCVSDSDVTATVSVSFNTLFPYFVPGMTGWTLTQTAVMRYE
jgi:Flp pilus assembly protein TadG